MRKWNLIENGRVTLENAPVWRVWLRLCRKIEIRTMFAWYDMWIGVFWDRTKGRLYVLPLPCIGIVIQFPRGRAP